MMENTTNQTAQEIKKPNFDLMIGLGMLKHMYRKELISETEYKNMIKDFTKRMSE